MRAGNNDRETTGRPRKERTELRIEEHIWKYTGNARCCGGVVGVHVVNEQGTKKEFIMNKCETKRACV